MQKSFLNIFTKLLLVIISLIILVLIVHLLLYYLSFSHNKSSQIYLNIFHYFKNLIIFRFGDLKNNFLSNNYSSVPQLFFHYFKWSALLLFPSLILGTILGFILGYKGAKSNNLILNLFLNFLIFTFATLPIFIIIPLIMEISENLDIPIQFIEPTDLGVFFTVLSLILPIMLMTIQISGLFALYVKTNAIPIIQSSYVLYLKTQGLSDLEIFWKAIFKNLWLTLLNSLTTVWALSLSYSLIIERLFQIKGQSVILLSAFEWKETDLISFLVLFTGFILFMFQFACEFIELVLRGQIYFKLKKGKS